ncbi:MAG: GHKL domain-containing protein [Bacteroidetes bacterium]|nr:MAG: GHKL domain-containing protein [Bacteroidota bacterium]TAG89706.1 MAG: GHKL domain-containing protein [Bacteroidota bacterium]
MIKSYSLLIVLFVFCFSTDAQNIDSLQKELNKAKYDEQKAEIYKKLAWANRNIDLKKSLDNAHKGLALAQKFAEKKMEADMTRMIGIIYLHYVYHHEALDWNQKALVLSQRIDYEEGVAFCYDNFGVSNFYQKKYTDAIEYFEKALKIFIKINNFEGIGYANTHLSWVYSELKEYEKAINYAKNASSARKKAKEVKNIANSLKDIASIYGKIGRYKEAIEYMHQSIRIIDSVPNKPFIDEHYQSMANIFFKVDLDSAFYYAQLSETYVNKRGNKRQKVHIYKLYQKIYLAKKDFENAIKYQDLHYAYKDSIYNDDIERNNASFAARFEYQQKEKLLISEQKRKDAENQTKLQQQQSIIYMILLIMIFMCLLAYIFYKNWTEKQQLNNELSKKNAEIDQQNEELAAQAENLKEMGLFKDQLFSIISHDLRSPLAQVQSVLGVLDSGLIEMEEFMELIPDLTKTINVSADLLQNLLIWAKSQMQGQNIERQNFDIQEIIEQNIKLFNKGAQNKKVILETNLKESLFVAADKNMTDLVIRNLVNNAIKFCRENDKILISTQEQANNMLCVCIADTGTGIAQKNIDKLFSNKGFTQKGTSGEKGTGLGLTLCKDFVEKNNGKIWVESKEGEGSQFYFTLPLM